MNPMTIEAATEIAQRVRASYVRHDPRAGIDDDVRDHLEGSGWAIPATAFTDGDDSLTVANLAVWIRRNAVSEKPVGRPAEMDGGKRVNLYLDDVSLAEAARLGDGNVSEGVRIALRRAAATDTPQ